SGNHITGQFGIGNVVVGTGNHLEDIGGANDGMLSIGGGNRLKGGRGAVGQGGDVIIGDSKGLFPWMSLNVPFAGGRIVIAYRNSLGRDGGGVISSSYRFGRKWGGDVVVGAFVETTRGAEVLGFSALGWPSQLLERDTAMSEENLVRLLT